MVRSSILFLATSNASLVCSADKVGGGGTSLCICCARVAFNSEAATDLGGVKMGARLSLSRPGKRTPLDLKLYNENTRSQ